MKNNHNGDIFEQDGGSQNELLDELDSLRALLGEEIDSSAAITSVSDIRSVKEYMLLKQEADKAGVELDTWLAQRNSEQEPPGVTAEEEEIPLLDEVVELTPMPQESDNATLQGGHGHAVTGQDDIYAAAEAALERPGTSLEHIEELVEQIVEQKLQALKPQLQKQIFDEIRDMLPVERFK